MGMNKIELIQSLMKQDLGEFTFAIFSRENEETQEEEFTYTLKYSEPGDEDWDLVGFIGGNPEQDYNEEYINCTLFGY